MLLRLLALFFISSTSFAMETPVGTLGNAVRIFDALLDSGAEVRTSPGGKDSFELIRATNLVCTIQSAPEFDALCTFFTKGEKERVVRGVASSENSWMIGFSLISAGARKTQVSETVSEVRVKSLVCNTLNAKSQSTCTFMQD